MSMRRGFLKTGLLLAALSLVLAVAGCGSGSSSTSSSSTSSSSKEPATAFMKKGEKNTIPKFGKEASEEEREAVNLIVVKSLEARQDADFAAQCETLTKKAMALIPGAKNPQACPAALKKAAEPLSGTKGIREDTLNGSIAAMRVKGDKGYALYHGSDGQNYAVPLEKEEGTWRVNSIVLTVL